MSFLAGAKPRDRAGGVGAAAKCRSLSGFRTTYSARIIAMLNDAAISSRSLSCTLGSALIAHFAVGDGPEAWSFAAGTAVLWALSYFLWLRVQAMSGRA
jgi:hypothetical protein